MGGKGSGVNREQERLNKINEMLHIILSGKQTNKNKVIATIQLRHGTSRRTALEYVNVLIDAGKIKEVDGRLQSSR